MKKQFYLSDVITKMLIVVSSAVVPGLSGSVALAADPAYYVKKDNWQETMRASREAVMKLEQSGEMVLSLPDLGESDFTISAWIKTRAEGGTIIAKAPAQGEWAIKGKVFFLSNGAPALDVGWVGAVETDTKVNDGRWHHVALAKEDELEFYVDGRLIETGELELGPDSPRHVLKIGFCNTDFPDQSGFEGAIDEIRIYNRRLSQEEIVGINNGRRDVKSGLAGWWRFEAGAADSSGNMNHGRAIGTELAEGKLGKALRFSGKSHVLLPVSQGMAARNRIWELLGRDFDSVQARKQIKWEMQDGIWDDDWEPGDLKSIGLRYAEASRDIGKLAERAGRLAAGIDAPKGLEKAREAYYLSRTAEEVYGDVDAKIDLMQDEIDYLDENHGGRDTRWLKYKQRIKELAAVGEKLLSDMAKGGTSAVEKMAALEGELEKAHQGITLRLPSGPEGPGRFGAYYTRLKYSLEWDRKWRIGPDADVVVRFDRFGHRFVFWRGTSFIPCWVAEGGGWYTNEFFERRGGPRSGTVSMVEPMSDKQARYSHVRIIESNNARVVIHWRYAPVDLKYSLAYIDKESGWGDWADEYYTIYPDAVGVRKATLQTSSPEDWTEYQESIVINQPGTRPEDNMHYAAVTLVNMQGQSHTYSWEHTWPDEFDKPVNGNIQVVNLKGKTRPFSIVDPEDAFVKAYPKYGAKTRFHCWNHWPVAQEESDTTVATTFDKPSHTSLSHITWKPYTQSAQSRTWVMLHGMTDGDAADLAGLAKSWLNPPELTLKKGLIGISDYVSYGFDMTERAWKLRYVKKDEPTELQFDLQADNASPVINPAFVVENWGRYGAEVKLDGKTVKEGQGCRCGHRLSEAGYDLIVWVETESTRPLTVSLRPTIR